MIIPPQLSHLPAPSADAQALSDQLAAHIGREITANGGAISFARFMELALYAPGLGYYSAGSRKLGNDGDFITAPELSPLFARTLARQLAQLHGEGLRNVFELGAGSGALAAGLLLEMSALGCVPENYFILELSADLRDRQHTLICQRAPKLHAYVRWIDAPPRPFDGVMIANEVLDATPAHLVVTRTGQILEGVVQRAQNETGFLLHEVPASGALLDTARQLALPANNYHTEINLAARVLVKTLAPCLRRGVMLFIDYGFPAREFYHPQRDRGTLMCHYRHHAHDDPFAFLGLQDITTHVDFSAIAQAAMQNGAQLSGYTSQAQFLINCGLIDLLAQTPAGDTLAYAPLAAQAQKLTSPAEMGELFKVIALGKNFEAPLIGFARGDKSHTL